MPHDRAATHQTPDAFRASAETPRNGPPQDLETETGRARTDPVHGHHWRCLGPAPCDTRGT